MLNYVYESQKSKPVSVMEKKSWLQLTCVAA